MSDIESKPCFNCGVGYLSPYSRWCSDSDGLKKLYDFVECDFCRYVDKYIEQDWKNDPTN